MHFVFFDYFHSHLLVKHWQNTLPSGIRSKYSFSNPKIFFHGRTSDPYFYFKRYGYFADDGRHNLWTVGITDHSSDIHWCLQPTYRFIVVFKSKHDSKQKNRVLVTNKIKADTIVKSLDLQDSVKKVMLTQPNIHIDALNTSYDLSQDSGLEDMEIAH